MTAWLLSDAVALVATPAREVVLAATAAAAVSLTEPAMRARAAEPSHSWAGALIAGAHLVRTGAGDTTAARVPLRRRALMTVALLVCLFVLMTWQGAASSRTLVLLLAGLGAVCGIASVYRASWRSVAGSTSMARRLPHVLSTVVLIEAVALLAIAVAAAAAMSAARYTALAVVELVAVAVAARLFQLLGGRRLVGPALGAIPIVFLLAWMGAPSDAGLAGALLWWSGLAMGAVALGLLARLPVPASRPDAALGRDGARLLHRAAFALIGVLPKPARRRLRQQVFDTMFAASDDPWAYSSTYEQRKRGALVDRVRGRYAAVVEIGCADGHNLEAIARACPDSAVLGTDVSREALEVARRRTSGLGNVAVVAPESLAAELSSLDADPCCFVLSEILYYLVTERAMRESFAELLSPGPLPSEVLMMHGGADAAALHRRLVRALRLEVVHEEGVDDPVRPFTLMVARTTVTAS